MFDLVFFVYCRNAWNWNQVKLSFSVLNLRLEIISDILRTELKIKTASLYILNKRLGLLSV